MAETYIPWNVQPWQQSYPFCDRCMSYQPVGHNCRNGEMAFATTNLNRIANALERIAAALEREGKP